jgi:alkanesulfonate monooxygenase SsuD/methylene tetrahydromethanopterin reductase-like flavin-dependent oxidoreductase (luciferase family)
MENHGTRYETRFKKLREQIEVMNVIWTREKAESHREVLDFPLMMTWPKSVQKPHPPIIVSGVFCYAARRAIRYGDGIIPQGSNAGSVAPEEFLPHFRQMAEEAGRHAKPLSVTLGGAPEDPDSLSRYRDLGVTRMNVSLPSAKADQILPVLDRLARSIPQLH